jgi:hypothetical protein
MRLLGSYYEKDGIWTQMGGADYNMCSYRDLFGFGPWASIW